MRRTLLGIAACLVGLLHVWGCAAPRNYVTRVPKEQSVLFVCAQQQLMMQNYNIIDSSKEAGFIRASKQTTGGGAKFFLNLTLFDELNIAIVQAPDGGSQMRVNAVTAREQASGFGAGAGSRTQEEPSPTVIRDAETIIESCAGTSAAGALQTGP
jgi:hypothetical protein